MKLLAKTIEDRLSRWPVARLATFSADGQPHQVPIVFVWQTGKIWSPIDGKQKRDTIMVRVKNALMNPKGSILLDDYSNDWSQLWWLRVDVTLEVIYLNDISKKTQIEAQNAITGLIQKYPQYKTTAVLSESSTLLAMTPTNYQSWQAS